MKTIDQWLNEYGESHTNKTNKAIHWICIPLIMFSLVGALWSIPVPEAFASVPVIGPVLNVGSILMVLALLFYIRLSVPLFFGFIIIAALIIMGNYAINTALDHNGLYHFLVSLAIFVGAWIFQFIGHNIEGKKPSFFKDLQFLLIGPAWLLHFIYKKVGIPYK
ncbi:MAG: Mpo1-like protein [Chitinophagales bacterium]|nr:Mpo1-like protein [Chitinophagales bacterium]